MKQKADIWLADNAVGLPDDPRYNSYRKLMLWYWPPSSPPPQSQRARNSTTRISWASGWVRCTRKLIARMGVDSPSVVCGNRALGTYLMSVSNRALLVACICCAFLPLLLFWLFLRLDLPLFGGPLFNPMNLAACLWLLVTIVNYRCTRTRTAKWLFVLFPVAFLPTAIGFLFWVWAHGSSN
jgi:hypothetical protein